MEGIGLKDAEPDSKKSDTEGTARRATAHGPGRGSDKHTQRAASAVRRRAAALTGCLCAAAMAARPVRSSCVSWRSRASWKPQRWPRGEKPVPRAWRLPAASRSSVRTHGRSVCCSRVFQRRFFVQVATLLHCTRASQHAFRGRSGTRVCFSPFLRRSFRAMCLPGMFRTASAGWVCARVDSGPRQLVTDSESASR